MKKIFFAILLTICLSFTGFFLSDRFIDGKNVPQNSQKVINEIAFGTPRILEVEKLNITANVENVGMDSKGRMDAPKNVENVAWYNLGAKPGQTGSAVFAGHFDTPKGDPAVFYNLKNLKKGDSILIKDEKGKTLKFLVEKIDQYDSEEFPLKEVFADNSGKWLNLITCDGVWDKESKNYSKRLVVFSKLEE